MPHHSQSLQLTARSDLVISSRHGTEGGHSSLDYIPGSVLLGAAVAAWLRSGRTFDPDLFLSGRLRFGNAYPVDSKRMSDTSPSLPIPLAWHHPKDEEDEVVNAVKCSLEPRENEGSVQMKQFRKEYFDPTKTPSDGIFRIKTRHTSRMKTAIDREGYGRNAVSQLFDYQAIESGQSFQTSIEADNSIDLSVFKFIIDALTQGGIRVGRSRSAEFGRVDVERSSSHKDPEPAEAAADRIVLYLTSDLALMRNGNPVLEPSPKDFGLDEEVYNLDLARTFIRTRSFSPWIQFRDGYDIERQVISKGSVISFARNKASQSSSLAELRKHLVGGLGLHRSEGCGRILVNPDFLVNVERTHLQKVEEALPAANSPQTPAPEPPSRITRLLRHRLDTKRLPLKAEPIARKWAKTALALMAKVDDEVGEAPGKTQWSNVRTLASSTASPEQVRKDLLEFFSTSGRTVIWTEEVFHPIFMEREKNKRGSLAQFLIGDTNPAQPPCWGQKWFCDACDGVADAQRGAFWKLCLALTATHLIRQLNGSEPSNKEPSHG